MNPKEFKMIREKFGLTQTELAAVFGLSGRLPITHYESGVRNPSAVITALMRIFDALSERKAMELIELLREHQVPVKKPQRRKKHGRKS